MKMASPFGVLKIVVKNGMSGEVVGWDEVSGKPIVRFQLEETQVLVAVPVHWLSPLPDPYVHREVAIVR